MILGTAGHIDHGKTTLVRALTGVDTDRLPEEKRRGITIDLGFAPLFLEGVGQIGVVDVPGHEAFVRTMVAGATGIDLALVVIAADEGVMPQTREHLAILSLLGVRNGVVALTKSDLVDAEWLSLVEDDVRGTIAQTSLSGAAIIPVSSTTGAGLDALKDALAHAARDVIVLEGSATDLFRIPVDRAFTVRGTGTVVTGTVWSGTLDRDATVHIFPADIVARVRGLHTHGAPVSSVTAGDRAAIALVGVDLDQVGRGAVLVQGDAWRASRVLRCDVSLLPDCELTLGPRSRVRFHLGTNDVGARIVVHAGSVSAGESAAARVVLDEPLVTRAGDRFVIRAPSPVATIGGGTVTDPHAPHRARPWNTLVSSFELVLRRFLSEAGANGLHVGDLPVRLGIHPAHVEPLVKTSDVWRVGARLIGATVRDRLASSAMTLLDAHHAEYSLESGAPMQWLRSQLGAPDDVASAILAELALAGSVEIHAGLVRRSGFLPSLSDAQAKRSAAILAEIVAADTEPPTTDELAARLHVARGDIDPLLHWLSRQGVLVAVEGDRYYSRQAVDGLKRKMSTEMAGNAERTPAELRDLLGLSRKFLIPFLEYCDRESYTVRTELGRRLSAQEPATGVP